MQHTNDCRTCKYYLAHYVIDKDLYLTEIGGHCINDELVRKHPRKPYLLYENCEYREEKDPTEEIEKPLRYHLKYMERKLSDLTLILRHYEKNRSDHNDGTGKKIK